MSSDGSNEFSRCPASHKCTRLYLHLFATFISNWVAERKSHVNPAHQLLLAEHSERCVLWLRRKSPKLKKVRQLQWHQPAQQQSLKFIVTFFPKLTHKCRTFLQLVGIYIYTCDGNYILWICKFPKLFSGLIHKTADAKTRLSVASPQRPPSEKPGIGAVTAGPGDETKNKQTVLRVDDDWDDVPDWPKGWVVCLVNNTIVNRRLFWVFCFLPNSSLKWSLVECEIAFSSCGWLSQNVKSLLLMAQKKGLRGCVPLHVSVMCREGWQQPLRIEEIRQAAENHEPWAVKARLCLHWTFAEQTTVLQLQFTELVHAMHMHTSFSIESIRGLLGRLQFGPFTLIEVSISDLQDFQAMEQFQKLERCAHNAGWLGKFVDPF